MLQAGDKAPEFTLMSDANKEVSLHDYLGKSDVIVYFYPKDNTSGCTKEACSFRDTLPKITEKNAAVLGISPDSVKSHQNFVKKHDLNFTLLSDPDHKVAEAFGAWGEKKMYGKTYMGIIRSTFVIGKDGIIKHVFKKVKTAVHGEEVLEIL
jgi:peroxiredoxin Q/BCP